MEGNSKKKEHINIKQSKFQLNISSEARIKTQEKEEDHPLPPKSLMNEREEHIHVLRKIFHFYVRLFPNDKNESTQKHLMSKHQFQLFCQDFNLKQYFKVHQLIDQFTKSHEKFGFEEFEKVIKKMAAQIGMQEKIEHRFESFMIYLGISNLNSLKVRLKKLREHYEKQKHQNEAKKGGEEKENRKKISQILSKRVSVETNKLLTNSKYISNQIQTLHTSQLKAQLPKQKRIKLEEGKLNSCRKPLQEAKLNRIITEAKQTLLKERTDTNRKNICRKQLISLS